jgi:hypothetical protein
MILLYFDSFISEGILVLIIVLVGWLYAGSCWLHANEGTH